MARHDIWGEDGEYEAVRRGPDREDFGQADYSTDYAYDPRARSGYRLDGPAGRDGYSYMTRPSHGPEPGRRFDEPRDLRDGRPNPAERPPERRRGPSDRVLWAVISERLEDERRLDLSDVEVSVHHGEVFLNGTVRHKADKRRIEDIADIEGVRNVQNNLRVREGRRGLF